jgi:hypothetical protein
MDNFEATLWSSALIVVGIFVLMSAYKNYRRYRLARDIPRSMIRSLAIGISEIHARVKPLELLTAPFSGDKCVWCKYSVQEYRPKKKGSDWVTIAYDDIRVPFLARDDTGEVRIEPTGAEIITDVRREFKQDVGFVEGFGRMFDGLERWGKSSAEKLAGLNLSNLQPIGQGQWTTWTRGDRHFKEYYLAPDDPLYIMGTVAIDSQSNELVVRKGSNNPMYFIGDKAETEIIRTLKKKFITGTIFGIIAIVGGLGVLFHKQGILF